MQLIKKILYLPVQNTLKSMNFLYNIFTEFDLRQIKSISCDVLGDVQMCVWFSLHPHPLPFKKNPKKQRGMQTLRQVGLKFLFKLTSFFRGGFGGKKNFIFSIGAHIERFNPILAASLELH